MQSFKLYRFRSRTAYEGAERRQKPRIYFPVLIKIRANARTGERFEFDTCANDLGAGGFSAHSLREFRQGQQLFCVVRFSLKKVCDLRTTTIAARGIVLRSEKRLDGSYLFASTFDRHRFL
jgi:hypothetical protein